MKGFLYFAGSTLRWAPQKPREFIAFHSYILGLYGLTHAFNDSGLLLTIGAFLPLFFLISRGLPVDCLNYESAIKREFSAG